MDTSRIEILKMAYLGHMLRAEALKDEIARLEGSAPADRAGSKAALEEVPPGAKGRPVSCELVKLKSGAVVLANVARGRKLTERDRQALEEYAEYCRERAAAKRAKKRPARSAPAAVPNFLS